MTDEILGWGAAIWGMAMMTWLMVLITLWYLKDRREDKANVNRKY